jgi:hypothetical protein
MLSRVVRCASSISMSFHPRCICGARVAVPSCSLDSIGFLGARNVFIWSPVEFRFIDAMTDAQGTTAISSAALLPPGQNTRRSCGVQGAGRGDRGDDGARRQGDGRGAGARGPHGHAVTGRRARGGELGRGALEGSIQGSNSQTQNSSLSPNPQATTVVAPKHLDRRSRRTIARRFEGPEPMPTTVPASDHSRTNPPRPAAARSTARCRSPCHRC